MERLESVRREPGVADWRRRQPQKRPPPKTLPSMQPLVRAATMGVDEPDAPCTVDVRV